MITESLSNEQTDIYESVIHVWDLHSENEIAC